MIDMDDLAARLHSHFILDAMCPTGCDHEDAPTEEHAVAIVALEYVREALLSDEAVERAARSLFYGDIDPDLDVTWATAHEGVRTEYLAMASVALTAAIGDDDE